MCARSESYAAEGSAGREAHGVVLARAVAELAVLVELAAPLLAVDGVLLASKTRPALEKECRGGGGGRTALRPDPGAVLPFVGVASGRRRLRRLPQVGAGR